MKKQVVNVLTKIGFLSMVVLVTVVGSAQGQSLATQIRANIPFDFSVGDQKLPAGEYSIGRENQQTGDTFVRISSIDGRANAMLSTIPVETLHAKDNGTLVFHQYGNQYFLFQVWPADSTTGRSLSKSRGEREIQRNLAANSSAGKTARNVMVGASPVVCNETLSDQRARRVR
jgi:hypothetical protein